MANQTASFRSDRVMGAVEVRLQQMYFPKPLAEAKIRRREESINTQLIRLLAFDVDEIETRYRLQLLAFDLDVLLHTNIRVVPIIRRISHREYFRLLYTEPFHDNAVPYVSYLIKLVIIKTLKAGQTLHRNSLDEDRVALLVCKFHHELSRILPTDVEIEKLMIKMYPFMIGTP